MRKASFVLGTTLAIAGWLGVAGTMLLLPVTAEAQQTVSQKVGVPLKAAQDAVAKKRWDQALGKIREADAAPGKTAPMLPAGQPPAAAPAVPPTRRSPGGGRPRARLRARRTRIGPSVPLGP